MQLFPQIYYEADGQASGADTVPGETPPAPPPVVVATVPVTTFQARVDELTAQRHEEKRRADALQVELIALQAKHTAPPPTPVPGAPPVADPKLTATLTEEVINRRAEALAETKATEKVFNDRCNAVYAVGQAAYGKEFDSAVSVLGSTGLVDRDFLELALDMEEPAKVIVELAKDPEKALALAKMPAAKKALAMARMFPVIAAPMPKVPSSGAPPPITPPPGGAPPPNSLSDSVPIGDWMVARKAQIVAGRAK